MCAQQGYGSSISNATLVLVSPELEVLSQLAMPYPVRPAPPPVQHRPAMLLPLLAGRPALWSARQAAAPTLPLAPGRLGSPCAALQVAGRLTTGRRGDAMLLYMNGATQTLRWRIENNTIAQDDGWTYTCGSQGAQCGQGRQRAARLH